MRSVYIYRMKEEKTIFKPLKIVSLLSFDRYFTWAPPECLFEVSWPGDKKFKKDNLTFGQRKKNESIKFKSCLRDVNININKK